MNSFFSRLGASFTPSFLARFKHTSVGQSVGYYFLVWLVFLIVGIIAVMSLVWHFSAPQKITPFLARIPVFELQFQNNILVKTAFPVDPYIRSFDGVQIFFSTQLSDVPAEYSHIAGLYLLRDNIVINQPQQATQKMTKVLYTDMKIGDKIINNAFVSEKFLTKYPPLRQAFLYLVIPFVLIVGLLFSCFFFVMSFFWSLVVFLVSKISSSSRLTYEQSLVFVLHMFLPVFIVGFILSWLDMYFIFLPTLLFVCFFFFNAAKSK